MKRSIFALSLLIAHLAFCHDTIIETASLQEILNRLSTTEHNKNTLITFDIDNTLVVPEDDFGSDHWFCALLKKQQEVSKDFEHAYRTVLPLYLDAQEKITLKLIEPNTPALIRALRNKGFLVIGLTARYMDPDNLTRRSLALIDRTSEQLNRLGIHFACAMRKHQPLALPKPSCYKYGVIFSGLNDKGTTLLHFFDVINYQPKKVIFIDDKMKNIEDVRIACRQRGIDCTGIRYGKLDERVKRFDLTHTEK